MKDLIVRDRAPHNLDDPGRKMSTMRMLSSGSENTENSGIGHVEHLGVRSLDEEKAESSVSRRRKLSALGVESVETSGSSHSGDTGMEGLELENDGNSESSRSGDTGREKV